MNGTTEERHLMNCLVVLGWQGVRGPASGSAPREQPDVLAAKRGVILVTEAKAGGPPRNPEDVEVRDLRTFAEGFAGAAVVAARFKGDRAFYLARPEDMSRTPSGHFSIPSDPSRFPFEAVLDFQPPDDEGDDYDVRVQVLDDDIAQQDDPLVAWVARVAQDQASGVEA